MLSKMRLAAIGVLVAVVGCTPAGPNNPPKNNTPATNAPAKNQANNTETPTTQAANPGTTNTETSNAEPPNTTPPSAEKTALVNQLQGMKERAEKKATASNVPEKVRTALENDVKAFFASLCSDDAAAHHKWLLSEELVKTHFGDAGQVLMGGRTTSVAAARDSLRTWIGKTPAVVNEVKYDAVRREGGRYRVSTLVLKYSAGAVRGRVEVMGAIETAEGWRFIRATAARSRF